MSAFLAAGGVPGIKQLLLIIAALVTARSAAMSFNRLVDTHYDVNNPQGNFLVQKLDCWVAGIIGYQEAKSNYDALKSIPGAIKKQVDREQAELDQIVKGIKDIEKEASDRHGLTTILEQGHNLDAKKKEILQKISVEDQNLTNYSQEKQELNGAKDQYHRQALDKLKFYLKSEGISALKQRAKDTPHPEDDQLVGKIELADARIKGLKEDCSKFQDQQKDLTKKLTGLREIAQNYSYQNYDSDKSYFNSDFNIDSFLIGYLSGQYTAFDVNRHIGNNDHVEYHESYSNHDSSSSDSCSNFSSGSSGFGGGGYSSGGGF